MELADTCLSIADLRRLGAMEIYPPVALVAFASSREPEKASLDEEVDEQHAFTLRDLFGARTKFLRQLWLARQPGVLPAGHVRRFGLIVAEKAVERLRDEGTLHDIRLKAAIAGLSAVVEGLAHLRSIDALREEVLQAVDDHQRHAEKPQRAAGGCRVVLAALDPDGHESGAQAAYHYLDLFSSRHDQDWLRATLLELIEQN